MVLVSVCGGLRLFLPKCQPDHNDCSCNDKSFKDCQQPTAEQEESVENLEQCLAKCEEFSAVGVCEWLIYQPTGECLMFGISSASMEEYIDSCNREGLPTRREDGTCLADMGSLCNPIVCPPPPGQEDGCQPCDDNSSCNLNFHLTECSMTTASVETSFGPRDFSGCQAFCTTMGMSNPITYLTWSKAEKECSCFSSGERACVNQERFMALKSLPYSLLLPLFCPALTQARKGFLAVGGLESPDSAELWRPPPNSWSCSIPPPPRQMLTPSVNLLGGTPLACYMDSCDWLTENGWETGPSTLFNRTYHSSHILGDDRLLLMGGRASPNTSEILQVRTLSLC